MASEGDDPFLLLTPSAAQLNEVLTTNIENLVITRPENLASVCGHYVSLVQSVSNSIIILYNFI